MKPLSLELQSLIEARDILHEKAIEAHRGPDSIFTIVLHAMQYVDKLLANYLRSEKASS